jgi:hypothetical protein
MSAQPDLFAPVAAAPADPLAGLMVKMPSTCKCSGDLAVIDAGIAMHRASLHCRSCGRHRGWLSKTEADFIERIAATFGAPSVITLRGSRP